MMLYLRYKCYLFSCGSLAGSNDFIVYYKDNRELMDEYLEKMKYYESLKKKEQE